MARGKKTPIYVREKVLNLYSQGEMNIREVAESVGIAESTAYFILKESGVDVSSRRFNQNSQQGSKKIRWKSRDNADEIDIAIRSDYPSFGPKAIADKYGLTESVVSMRAWRLGVKSVGHGERSGDTRAERGDNCNQGFFETWSGNLAWLLGFTWADGAISNGECEKRITYRCAVQDEEIINKIMTAIESKAKIERFPSKLVNGKYQSQEQVGFRISSKKVVDLMIEKYGIPPNKSNIDPPFPKIPDEFMSHFTRGAIDGDGSICQSSPGRTQIVCYGSCKFIDSLRVKVANLAGCKTPFLNAHGASSKLFRCAWAAQDDVKKILSWIYPEGEYLRLERKHSYALDYLSSRSNCQFEDGSTA